MVAVGMKIGALAGRSGLPVKTLRFYGDLGLLPAIGRSEGVHRLFVEESLQHRLAGWQSDPAQDDAVICPNPQV